MCLLKHPQNLSGVCAKSPNLFVTARLTPKTLCCTRLGPRGRAPEWEPWDCAITCDGPGGINSKVSVNRILSTNKIEAYNECKYITFIYSC